MSSHKNAQSSRLQTRQAIKQVASEERRRLVSSRNRIAPPLCHETAPVITKRLKDLGLHAHTVNGMVVPCMKSDLLLMHAWNEAEGFLIDITIDQLGGAFQRLVVDDVRRCRDHPRMGLLYSPYAEYFPCTEGMNWGGLDCATRLRLYRIWVSYLNESFFPALSIGDSNASAALVRGIQSLLDQGRRSFASERTMNDPRPENVRSQALTVSRLRRCAQILDKNMVADVKRLGHILDLIDGTHGLEQIRGSMVAFGLRSFEGALAVLFEHAHDSLSA